MPQGPAANDSVEEGKHRICWYTPAEEKLMLDMANHIGLTELLDFIMVGTDTEFRCGELLGLKMSN